MINDYPTPNSLCVIPSRKGSKRFPDKNKALFNNQPLIVSTVHTAWRCFTRVIFTSDDEEALQMVRDLHIDSVTVSERPKELASDTSQVIDTVKYYVNEYAESVFDEIWLCLPTCPLRTCQDVENCKQLLRGEYCDSVISITDCEFPPSLSLNYDKYNKGIESSCLSRPWENKNHRSQNHRKTFRPNGAIYGARIEDFIRADYNFYSIEQVKGYYMSRENSIDIDSELDLKLANLILGERE